MHSLCVELIKGVFTLTAVALGSVVALLVYFRQKEYELTKQRYLEQGVDVVAAELETAFGVVSHNYARCLQICKSFRDVDDKFDPKEIDKGFLQFDGSKFHQIAHHRISALLGSNLIWEVFQTSMAYAVSANAMMVTEVPEAMRILSGEPKGVRDRQSDGERMIDDMRTTHDEGFKYAHLVRELHALSLLLEASKLNLSAVAKFRDRADAKAIIARLTLEFPNTGDDGAKAA